MKTKNDTEINTGNTTRKILSSKDEYNFLLLKSEGCSLNEPPKTKNDMIKQALLAATNKDFMNMVEKEIGDPKKNETKEDYIKRAEENLFKLMNNFIKNK